MASQHQPDLILIDDAAETVDNNHLGPPQFLENSAAHLNQEPSFYALSSRGSTYTLHTIDGGQPDGSSAELEPYFDDDGSDSDEFPLLPSHARDLGPQDAASLLDATAATVKRPRNYGSAARASSSRSQGNTGEPPPFKGPWWKRPVVQAAIKVASLFVLSSLVLSGTLYLTMPRLHGEDKHLLHIPRSFEDLKGLNTLLSKYRSIYPFRIVICWVAVYLFIQAYIVPGSMYLTILGGAIWGVPICVGLTCFCVATGSCLCYSLSGAFGPAVSSMPKWKARIDSFGDRVDSNRADLLSYLIILRISPGIPPHWVVNIVAPHVRIKLPIFWLSCCLGIIPMTIIQASVGGGLEQMTSAEDFHLLSVRNVLMLSASAVAFLVPVGVRYMRRGAGVGDAENGKISTSVEL